MKRLNGHLSLFQRLPHGGHVDLHLSSSGRVALLVNSGGDLALVLAELDTVRTHLQRLATTNSNRPSASLGALETPHTWEDR